MFNYIQFNAIKKEWEWIIDKSIKVCRRNLFDINVFGFIKSSTKKTNLRIYIKRIRRKEILKGLFNLLYLNNIFFWFINIIITYTNESLRCFRKISKTYRFAIDEWTIARSSLYWYTVLFAIYCIIHLHVVSYYYIT